MRDQNSQRSGWPIGRPLANRWPGLALVGHDHGWPRPGHGRASSAGTAPPRQAKAGQHGPIGHGCFWLRKAVISQSKFLLCYQVSFVVPVLKVDDADQVHQQDPAHTINDEGATSAVELLGYSRLQLEVALTCFC